MAFFEALAPCLVGMEACATSHYWARELTKLGHEVRLMPAKDVKAQSYAKHAPDRFNAAPYPACCPMEVTSAIYFGLPLMSIASSKGEPRGTLRIRSLSKR